MKTRIVKMTVGILIIPAAISIFSSCKGRTVDDVKSNGETIEVDVDIEEAEAQLTIAPGVDSAQGRPQLIEAAEAETDDSLK